MAMLAAFGAVARLLSQKDNAPVGIANMISGCLVASFSGVMAYFVCDYFVFQPNLSFVISGISGWIGPQMLDVFTHFVAKSTGIDLKAVDKSDAVIQRRREP
jgi:hypothetical protein